MSERNAGPEAAPDPAAVGQNDQGGENDFYATAATSTAATRNARGRSGTATRNARGRSGTATRNARGRSGTATDAGGRANEAQRVDGSSGSGASGSGSPDTEETAEQPLAPKSAGTGRSSGSGEGVALTRGKPETAHKSKVGMPRSSRKARLRLSRLDPWSVMKTAFLFSIAAGIILVVAVYIIWSVIGASGLLDSIDSVVGSVLKSPGQSSPFRVEQYVNTQKVMAVTALLACIDVVIITALTTLASFLYNLSAAMLGGLEVTLAED